MQRQLNLIKPDNFQRTRTIHLSAGFTQQVSSLSSGKTGWEEVKHRRPEADHPRTNLRKNAKRTSRP
jgi:hypothetical protein